MSKNMDVTTERGLAGADYVYTKLTSITWSMGLLHNFNSMRLNNEMCDVQVSLDGGIIIPAHSCVLAGASPFLKSLLVDAANPEIHMESFPAHLVQEIVEFIYTGSATIKKQELLVFHSIAATLNISTLTEMATKLIQDSVVSGQDLASPEAGTVNTDTQDQTAPLLVTPPKKSTSPVKPTVPPPIKQAQMQIDKDELNASASTDSPKDAKKGNCASRSAPTPRKSQRQRKPSLRYRNEITQLPVQTRTSTVPLTSPNQPSVSRLADSPVYSMFPIEIKQEIDDTQEYKPQGSDTPEPAQAEPPEENHADFQPVEMDNDFNISEVAHDSKLAKSLEGVVSQLQENAVNDEEGMEDQAEDVDQGQSAPDPENVLQDTETAETGSETLDAEGSDLATDDLPVATEESSQEPRLPEAIQVLQKKGGTFYLETVIPVIENYAEAPNPESESSVGNIPDPKQESSAEYTVKPLKLPGRKLCGISSIMCQQVPVHTGLTFMCEICSRCFTDQGTFERHRQKHKSVQQEDDPLKKFHCAFCPFKTKYNHTLQEHERTHTGVKPYHCQYCEKSFSHKKNHRMHETLHQNVTLPCPQCDKVFSYQPNLRKHIKVVHNPEFRPHKCPFCSQCFKIPETLKKHLVTHTDIRPYKCPRCTKAYFDKQSLNKHIKHTHENSGRRFACKDCGKEYKCRVSINKHKCLTVVDVDTILKMRPRKARKCQSQPKPPPPEADTGGDLVATVDMVEEHHMEVSVIKKSEGQTISDGETSSESDMDMDDLDKEAGPDTTEPLFVVGQLKN